MRVIPANQNQERLRQGVWQLSAAETDATGAAEDPTIRRGTAGARATIEYRKVL
jgi:hypothetical protein